MLTGRKNKYGEIVKATADGRLLAMYNQDSLGQKGRIFVRTDEEYLELAPNGIVSILIDGVRYKVIEYCNEYQDVLRRFYWYLFNKGSAYYGLYEEGK